MKSVDRLLFVLLALVAVACARDVEVSDKAEERTTSESSELPQHVSLEEFVFWTDGGSIGVVLRLDDQKVPFCLYGGGLDRLPSGKMVLLKGDMRPASVHAKPVEYGGEDEQFYLSVFMALRDRMAGDDEEEATPALHAVNAFIEALSNRIAGYKPVLPKQYDHLK